MIDFFRSLWLPRLTILSFTRVPVNRVHFQNDHISLSLINYVFYTLKMCFKITSPIWYQSPFKQLVSELHLLSIIRNQLRRVRSLRRQLIPFTTAVVRSKNTNLFHSSKDSQDVTQLVLDDNCISTIWEAKLNKSNNTHLRSVR